MSNGLSQAEIDALLKGEPAPEPAAAPPEDPNAVMTPDQIAALLAAQDDAEPAPAAAPPEDPNAVMTPDQIAALLAAQDDAEPEPPAPSVPEPNFDGVLDDMEIDAMGEIGNISMGTAATTLFTLLSHKVDITTPTVSLTTMRKISEEYPLPFVAVEVQYTLGLEGTNILFLRETDVKIITDLLMGGDGTNLADELTELHLSAISEVMNQMVGSSSTSLAKLMGISIDISPPKAYTVNLSSDAYKVYANVDEAIVRTSFDMVVEGLINSQIMQVTPVDFAKRMVANLVGGGAAAAAGISGEVAAPKKGADGSNFAPSQSAAAPQPAATQQAPPPQQQAPPPPQYAQQPPPPQYAQPPQYQYDPYGQPPPGYGYPPPGYGYPPPPQYAQPPQYQQQPQQVYNVAPAQFASFEPGGGAAGLVAENMDLLMDVPLTVSVELGKSSKNIKEILDFNVGTIVVLDKLAGEFVDIVVNGKLIAKGEVVVIDENYGARITDIVSPSKRLGQQ